MQFQYNADYPGLSSASTSTSASSTTQTIGRDPQQFPPADPIPCARITTRVFHPTRNQVATVQNVLIRTMNSLASTRGNKSGKKNITDGDGDSFSSNMSSSSSSSYDDDDDDSMILDDDDDDINGRPSLASRLPQQFQNKNNDDEIKYAYWIQRTIREAIYGRVLFAIILKRRPRYLVLNDGAEWEVTPDHCAVKEMSWQHIKRERDSLTEDPIKEVWSMQYLNRWWRQMQEQQLITPVQQQTEKMDINNDHANVTQSFLAMRNTNIIFPLDLLSDERNLYSIMPYCDGGELFERLDVNERFSENEARYWMDQILNGLENLQKIGICHRDMSLENLLVHNDGALIIDMGMCLLVPYCEEDPISLAVSFDNMKMNGGQQGIVPVVTSANNQQIDTCLPQQQQSSLSKHPVCGPEKTQRRSLIKPQGTCGKWIYMSPEIYRNDSFDGFAVDMWAAGVILFLMLTGFPPWEKACQTDERFHYMTAGYLVQMLTEWEIGLSSDAMDLLQRMLFLDPKDRLSLDQVRAHPWMINGRRDYPLGLMKNK
mmetsp:Transcript_34955/g.37851  ORF Transcript_34955/g.37851 Transcript_34955/m.37851 type:complete len:542 (+) Transcript_34955:71-1696(+)